jgi:dCTP deaminase
VNSSSDVSKENSLLSDLEILERLVADDKSCIFISPLVDPKNQLGPSSLDLHLGTELLAMQVLNSTHIDLTKQKKEIKEQINKQYAELRIMPDKYFVLHPGEFALGSTLEFIRLPKDIAGRLEGRSSIGRLGLQVHATAGFVDPGFFGVLTFELINAGKLPLVISPGICLGQMCFFKVKEVQVGYAEKLHRKYVGMLGPEGSKIDQDPELSG